MRGGRGIFAGAKTGYVVLRIEPSPALPASLSPLRFAPGLPAPFHAQQGAALRAPPFAAWLIPELARRARHALAGLVSRRQPLRIWHRQNWRCWPRPRASPQMAMMSCSLARNDDACGWPVDNFRPFDSWGAAFDSWGAARGLQRPRAIDSWGARPVFGRFPVHPAAAGVDLSTVSGDNPVGNPCLLL